MLKKYLFLFVVLCITSLTVTAQYQKLRPGIWKAALQRPDGHTIVFNFETATVRGRQVLYIINADERLLVDNVVQRQDSVWIQLPFFDARFAARIEKNGDLTGVYKKNYGTREEVIPFHAWYKVAERYRLGAPAVDLTGRWAVTFLSANNKSTPAIGEFTQEANGRITGTFLTATGDYRYLEGAVNHDSLHLSGFDGGHAFAFAARLQNKDSIGDAMMFSGLTGSQRWMARRNDTAQLPDEYTYTKLRDGESRLSFRFPATDGAMVSLDDARYKNKVVIIQLLGSWCPNCMDETAYLSNFYNQNRSRGVEIIGLAYERTTSFEASKKALATFQKKFKVQYPFLITGVTVTDDRRTEKTLPQLESIRAFPTSIIIDKKGNVRRIHTGFNGPGTGVHFTTFKKAFEALIDELVKE